MAVVMLIYCTANLAYFYAPVQRRGDGDSTRYREALPVATRLRRPSSATAAGA
jgi:hypothetical protein